MGRITKQWVGTGDPTDERPHDIISVEVTLVSNESGITNCLWIKRHDKGGYQELFLDSEERTTAAECFLRDCNEDTKRAIARSLLESMTIADMHRVIAAALMKRSGETSAE